jgi:hypothetical protein
MQQRLAGFMFLTNQTSKALSRIGMAVSLKALVAAAMFSLKPLTACSNQASSVVMDSNLNP